MKVTQSEKSVMNVSLNPSVTENIIKDIMGKGMVVDNLGTTIEITNKSVRGYKIFIGQDEMGEIALTLIEMPLVKGENRFVHLTHLDFNETKEVKEIDVDDQTGAVYTYEV